MCSSPSTDSSLYHVRFDPSTMSRLLVALMARIECGVLASGPSGELYHANVAARRELSDARVLSIAAGRVDCRKDCRDSWNSALHAAAVHMRSSLVCLSAGGGRLMVALKGRRTACSPLGLEMLANSHGLTSAERGVLRALTGNSTAREIAQSHGVKVATVRTQIQSVRDKLGVRSIDALLLRAAAVPRITARH